MTNMVRPKIAFVHSSLKFGGAERVTLNLAHALKAQGYDIDILLMSAEGELLDEAARDFNLIDLACSKTWMLPARLLKYLLHHRPTALVPSFWRLNLCACLARMLAPRTKLALWEHSPPSRIAHTPAWLYFLTASIFYRFATRVIAVSDGVAADIRRITIGLGSKVVTVYNAIPAPDLPPPGEALAPGHRIIWVGRLADPKNPALMLEAFSRLPASGGYCLDILGDGSQRDQLEQRAADLGIAERVRFLGFRSDAYEYMAVADLLALSSDREGLPSVVIEALNAGLAIVSTDCGEGVHEILGEGVYGTIVPVGAAEALADAMKEELARRRDPVVQRRGAARFEPAQVALRFAQVIGLPRPGTADEHAPAPAAASR